MLRIQFNLLLMISLMVLMSSLKVFAYTIRFQNSCSFPIWSAIGKAPNGQPDGSVRFGHKLEVGQTVDFVIANHQIGIRAWGRTGCDGSGANCKTGACNGGLVCTDAGITSHALLSEYGLGTDGREYWDLSYVGGQINIPTRLTGPDGQSVYCATGNCSKTQAFQNPQDFGAIRNSVQGGTYTHHFCG